MLPASGRAPGSLNCCFLGQNMSSRIISLFCTPTVCPALDSRPFFPRTDKLHQSSSVAKMVCCGLPGPHSICGMSNCNHHPYFRFLVCCACKDHTIHVFSLGSGRRVLSPICFGAAHSTATRLCCRGYHVMAVDAGCNMTVW